MGTGQQSEIRAGLVPQQNSETVTAGFLKQQFSSTGFKEKKVISAEPPLLTILSQLYILYILLDYFEPM